MEKITSFTIDHIRLQPGVYVSRKDPVGDRMVTTFDLRITSPNEEPVMNTAEIHAIEHLAATFLRNHRQWKEDVLYFGPMGCRTGFYLLMKGDLSSHEILPLVTECFCFIRDYDREIPGASAKGRLAMNAIQRVAMNDPSAVAIITPFLSIPVADRMLGFTASMYAIAMKVARPAINSVLTVVLFALSLNNFSNI